MSQKFCHGQYVAEKGDAPSCLHMSTAIGHVAWSQLDQQVHLCCLSPAHASGNQQVSTHAKTTSTAHGLLLLLFSAS